MSEHISDRHWTGKVTSEKIEKTKKLTRRLAEKGRVNGCALRLASAGVTTEQVVRVTVAAVKPGSSAASHDGGSNDSRTLHLECVFFFSVFFCEVIKCVNGRARSTEMLIRDGFFNRDANQKE